MFHFTNYQLHHYGNTSVKWHIGEAIMGSSISIKHGEKGEEKKDLLVALYFPTTNYSTNGFSNYFNITRQFILASFSSLF